MLALQPCRAHATLLALVAAAPETARLTNDGRACTAATCEQHLTAVARMLAPAGALASQTRKTTFVYGGSPRQAEARQHAAAGTTVTARSIRCPVFYAGIVFFLSAGAESCSRTDCIRHVPPQPGCGDGCARPHVQRRGTPAGAPLPTHPSLTHPSRAPTKITPAGALSKGCAASPPHACAVSPPYRCASRSSKGAPGAAAHPSHTPFRSGDGSPAGHEGVRFHHHSNTSTRQHLHEQKREKPNQLATLSTLVCKPC